MNLEVTPSEYVAVMSLYARFYQATDMGDPDEVYASCFTNDEVYIVDGKIHRKGLAEQLAKRRLPKPEAPRRHTVSSILLEKIDDETISARAHLVTVDAVDGQAKISTVGNYRDTLRCVDGSWRFARRELTTSYIDHRNELY